MSRRMLSKIEVIQLRKQGFTVSGGTIGSTITGLTDAVLKRHLQGAKARVTQLKRARVR